MRKLVISAALAVVALGSFAPIAAAIVPPDEVSGYAVVPPPPPEVGAGAVVPDPDANVAGVVIGAGLPSTGSDSMMPLQVAGGLLVAGVLVVFAVRRRRRASPEPAA